jgi:hypothetical protein
LLKARRAWRGAGWLVDHSDNINRRQNRVAHLGAHQPLAIGKALHRKQRQSKLHGLGWVSSLPRGGGGP